MLLSRRDPDDVSRTNLLDRTAPSLYAAGPSRHDQGLTQRVGVPGCAGARLERDSAADHACRIGRLEQRVNAYGARKILGRSFARRLRTTPFDFHSDLV